MYQLAVMQLKNGKEGRGIPETCVILVGPQTNCEICFHVWVGSGGFTGQSKGKLCHQGL